MGGGGVSGDERGTVRVFPACCKASKVASCLSHDGQPKLPNIGIILSRKQVYIPQTIIVYSGIRRNWPKKPPIQDSHGALAKRVEPTNGPVTRQNGQVQNVTVPVQPQIITNYHSL